MSLYVSLTCSNHHCESCGGPVEYTGLYSANITHNLGAMAEAAGCYTAVWRPEEAGFELAREITPFLRAAISSMEEYPAAFRLHDAANGWGTYDDFLPWLKEYLAACERYPLARVSVSR